MEQGFDVLSGSTAIGDPAMGLVTFDLRLSPGHYRCNRGALRAPTANDRQTIPLDGPFVFLVDAAQKERFLEWFHRTFNQCGFVIPKGGTDHSRWGSVAITFSPADITTLADELASQQKEQSAPAARPTTGGLRVEASWANGWQVVLRRRSGARELAALGFLEAGVGTFDAQLA